MFSKRPIYNQQLKCVAYEILSHDNMLMNDAVEQELVDLINAADSRLPLFIPFDLNEVIQRQIPLIASPIILKIKAEEINSKHSQKDLNDSLFSIALLIDTPAQLAWLNFAEYICLTEQLMTEADITKVVKYGTQKQRKIIAYGLDQPLNYERCKLLAMDFYCGGFLFKPQEDDQKEIAASKLSLLNLMQKIQKEDCALHELSQVIQIDPLLSYQLLKIANSVAFSTGHAIESIDQAVARLGLINLKNWITLFSMKNISDKPVEILESGLIRAYMAQEIAKKSGNISSQSAYTAGLLSILDCLLNKPMSLLVEKIMLSEDISTALIQRSGPLGELLTLVTAYEAGHWEAVTDAAAHGLDLSKLYIEGVNFVAKGSKVIRT